MKIEREHKSRIIHGICTIPVLFIGLLLPVILGILIINGIPVFSIQSFSDVFLGTEWAPSEGKTGLLPFIAGTVWVSTLAMVLAIPLGLLCMIYLAEYASPIERSVIKPFFDLMAGIPSVLCGLFGILIVVPLVRNYLAPVFGVETTGYCILSGGVILCLMILPTIVSLGDEILRSVPIEMKYASFVLGTTRWETFRHVTFKKASAGILSVILLAYSRAAGETMAVLMVVGNDPVIPESVWDGAYPLSALIANNYGEIMSVPALHAVMMMAAVLLIVLVLFFHIFVRVFLARVKRQVLA